MRLGMLLYSVLFLKEASHVEVTASPLDGSIMAMKSMVRSNKRTMNCKVQLRIRKVNIAHNFKNILQIKRNFNLFKFVVACRPF